MYRTIDVGIWWNEDFRPLSQTGKLLYIYLFSNEHSRPSGLFRLPLEYIIAESGMGEFDVASALSELSTSELIACGNDWVFVKGMLKYQSTSPKILAGARDDWTRCPCDSLRVAFMAKYPTISTTWEGIPLSEQASRKEFYARGIVNPDTLSIPSVRVGTLGNRNRNRNRNREQEQEDTNMNLKFETSNIDVAENSPGPSRQSTKKPSDEDRALAAFIFEKAKEVSRQIKSSRGWADIIRLMREKDKLSIAEQKEMFLWAHHDSFWRPNILSPRKLRDKWPTLEGQRKRQQQLKQRRQWPHYSDEKAWNLLAQEAGVSPGATESWPDYRRRIREALAKNDTEKVS